MRDFRGGGVEVSEGNIAFSHLWRPELLVKSSYPRATILGNHRATENGLRSTAMGRISLQVTVALARKPPWWKYAVLSQLSAKGRGEVCYAVATVGAYWPRQSQLLRNPTVVPVSPVASESF